VPELVGGSADLTPSNNTKAKDQTDVRTRDFSGHYIRYGVREHGMAAAMNGIAVHRGLIPYGGTFLTFSDYARPSIRLAAFMGVGVVYVMTHDSFGLGEDGTDPSANRAPSRVAGAARALCLPPGRRGRDRRVLGLGAAAARCSLAARSHPPGAAVVAHRWCRVGHRPQPLRPRRICPCRGPARASGHVAGDRLGSIGRVDRARAVGARRHRCRGRLDGMLGVVRAPAASLSPCGARLRTAGCRRGWGPVRLGALAWLEGG